MTLSDIAKKLFGAKRAETTSKVSDVSTLQGTVVSDSENGHVEVAFDADCTTLDGTNVVSIGTLASLKEGDQAIVMLEGGGVKRPTAIGAAGWGDRIQASIVETNLLIADKADIEDLEAANAHIGNLEADNLTINNRLEVAETSIGTLEAETAKIENLTAEQLEATTAYIEDLTAGNVTAQNIVADHGDFGTVKANAAKVQNLTAQQLEADHATVGSLDANYAKIDLANIANGTIKTAMIGDAQINSAKIANGSIENADIKDGTIETAKIKDAAITTAKIGDAQITTAKIGNAAVGTANIKNAAITNALIANEAVSSSQILSVSANKLTAGTINAAEIDVTNLHASSLIVDKLNGQPVLGGYAYVNKNISGYSSKNPSQEGWYEMTANGFALSTDTSVDSTKAYYTQGNPTKLYDQDYIDGLEEGLNQRIDGAIETFTGDHVPTLNTYPAVDWTTDDAKSAHVGDIYFVTNAALNEDGYNYRFAYDNATSSYRWVLIKDSDVTKALQDITDLQDFESDTTSWINETDQGLVTIRQNHTALSGVVDKTVKESVQLWYTKADTTAPGKPTSQVTSTSTAGNAWRTVVPAWNASYPNYYYCWQYLLADNTYAWSDVVRDIAMGESQGTARDAKTEADANIKSSVQLWYTKANSTAPSKPTSQVTTNNAATGNAWNLAVPTYNASYPHYFYCYQQQKGDGSYQWSDVVYDKGTTEAMQKAQAALPSSTFTTFQQNTFKELVDEVDEQSSTITQMTERVETLANPNLTPWFSMPLTDVYDVTTNPNGYWKRITTHAQIPTYVSNQFHNGSGGWAHIVGNVTGSNPFIRFEPMPITLKPSTEYTFMLEIDGTFASTFTNVVWRLAEGNETDAYDLFGSRAEVTSPNSVTSGTYYRTATTNANFSDAITLSRAYVQLYGTGTFDVYARISLYEGDYSGPYKPYVPISEYTETKNVVNSVKQTADANTASISSLTSTVNGHTTTLSNHQTSITQNANNIALKANSSDVYTKTATDGLISTEVTNRNAAITAATNAINLSVSETYTTKTEFGDLKIGGTNLLPTGAVFPLDGSASSKYFEDFLVSNGRITPFVLEAGQTYTLSMDVTTNVVPFKVSAGCGNGDYAKDINIADFQSSGRIFLTFTPSATHLASGNVFAFRAPRYSTTQNFTWKVDRVKLEKGNKATDWSPAPEDAAMGGRNLLRFTSAPEAIQNGTGGMSDLAATKGWYKWSANGTTSNTDEGIKVEHVSGNTTYTGLVIPLVEENALVGEETAVLSFQYRTNLTNIGEIYLLCRTGGNARSRTTYPIAASENDWAYFESEVRFVSTEGKMTYALLVPYVQSGWIEFRNGTAKLEKGRIGTPWTAAHEDSEAAVRQARADIKVTTDGISAEVAKVSSAKYVNSSTASWTLPNIKTYAAEGRSENWNVTSTSNLRVGDTVYIKGTDSTRACPVYIKTTVTAINSATNFTGTSHGYEDVLPVETIKSTINQSADNVKIQANHVNIEGATIFTTGRLSTSSLSNDYANVLSSAETYADGLEIGGTNLIPRSHWIAGLIPRDSVCNASNCTLSWYLTDSSPSGHVVRATLVNASNNAHFYINGLKDAGIMTNGERYVASVWVRASKAASFPSNAMVEFHNGTYKRVGTANLTTSWQRQSCKFTYSSSSSYGAFYLIYPQKWTGLSAGDYVEIGGIQIEKGDKATDWSPCPDDQNGQYGGTNLFSWPVSGTKWKDEEHALNTYQNTGSFTQFTDSLTFDPLETIGELYTISFDVKSPNGTTAVNLYNSNGTPSAFYFATVTVAKDVGNEWVHCEHTVENATHENGNASYNRRIEIYAPHATGVLVRKIKVERGSKATDWTPAPEDVDAAIEAVPGFKYLNSNYTNTLATVQGWCAEGIDAGNWAVSSTAGVRVGDTVYIKTVPSDNNSKPVYCIITVTSVTSATALRGISHGYLNTAVTDTANAAAPKTAAVSEEQYVYASYVSGTNSASAPSSWVTETGDKQNTWSTKRPTYNSTYPVVFVAKQRKTVSGAVTCTTPIKDDTVTIIDGGHITTGTIDATKVAVTNLDAANITSGYINAARIKAGSLSIGKLSDLNVGGKNLLLRSDKLNFSTLGSAAGSRKEYYSLNVGKSYMNVEHGTQVTISFDLYMTVATANPTLLVYNTNSKCPKAFSNSATGTGGASGVTLSFTAAAGSVIDERVSVTGYINDRSSPTLADNFLEFYSTYGTSNFYSVSNLKMERGTVATDWTAAPEDELQMVKIDTASRAFTTANWKTYGAVGHSENWNTGSSYDNSRIKVGDTAYLVGTVTDGVGGTATIIGTVTAVNGAGGSSSITMTSTQLIFGGDSVDAAAKTATNYITADSTGIKIAKASDTSNYQYQTSSGTDIYVGGKKRTSTNANGLEVFDSDGTTSLAKFGTSARIGKSGGTNVEIEDKLFKMNYLGDNVAEIRTVGLASDETANAGMFSGRYNGGDSVLGLVPMMPGAESFTADDLTTAKIAGAIRTRAAFAGFKFDSSGNVTASKIANLSAVLLPVTLFYNSSGGYGTINLNETVANFVYIEVFGQSNDGEQVYEKVYDPNGKTFTMSVIVGYGTNKVAVKSKRYVANGTQISVSSLGGVGEVEYLFAPGGVDGHSENQTSINKIKIYRVLGLRK